MECEETVRKVLCDRTLCCDEVFMQTMLLGSPFAGGLWDLGAGEGSACRLIDWTRSEGAGPHTWRMGDWPVLESSQMMFARKFDRNVDAEVIEALTRVVR